MYKGNLYNSGLFNDASFNVYNADGSHKTIYNIVKTPGVLNNNSFYVSKYTLEGNVEWVTQLGPIQGAGFFGQVGKCIASDSKNNVYVTGYFADLSLNLYSVNNKKQPIILTNTTGSTGENNGFIAKYDENGIC